MIREVSVSPKPKNRNAKILFLIAVFISAIAITTSVFIHRYKGIVGMFGIMMIVTATLFYVKFISPQFYYDITYDYEKGALFAVRQIVGKRQKTLCRIDLCDVVSLERENTKQRRAHVTESDVKRYVYTPTLFPSEVYRITVKNYDEIAEIIIEDSDGFAELLHANIKEAGGFAKE